MGLAGRLAVGVAASGVDTFREALLETLWCSLLDLLGDGTLTSGVRCTLAMLIGGRHSDGSSFEEM